MPATIPEWLKAPDVAADYARGLQIGAGVAEARERLSQQATELNMRQQAEAKRAQEEHDLQQQRIAVSAQYQKQQIQLRQQQLDQVKQVNDAKTANAARAYSARQQWQAGFEKIENDPNMTDEQKDSAKASFTMRLAPMMGMPGTEAAAMVRDLRTTKPTVPASLDTNSNPDYDIAHQPNGTISLHPKPRQVDPQVKVQVDPSTITSMPKSQAVRVIPNLPPELRTNAVNTAVMSDGSIPQGGAKSKRYRFDPDKGLQPVEDQ